MDCFLFFVGAAQQDMPFDIDNYEETSGLLAIAFF